MGVAQFAALQTLTHGAAQLGVVLLLGAAWSLAVLGPGLASAPTWRARMARLVVLAWLALCVGSLASLPLTIYRALGRWDLELVRQFAATTAQGGAVTQRCLAATVVIALTLAALWLAARPQRSRPEAGARSNLPRAVAGAALLAGLPLVDTLSRLSHAAVMAGSAYRLLDGVHLYVAGVWGGGLIALALWPWRSAENGVQAANALERALGRHSLTGLAAVLTLAASGTLAALVQLPAVSAIVTTSYGQALSTKLVLVGATLLAAAYNRWRLLPRLQAVGSPGMAVGLRLEAVLLLAVLLATALLTTRPLPHEML